MKRRGAELSFDADCRCGRRVRCHPDPRNRYVFCLECHACGHSDDLTVPVGEREAFDRLMREAERRRRRGGA